VGRRGWPKNKGRDGERAPMQWTAGRNAGFSRGNTTWLPVSPSYIQRNVAAEAADPNSLLNWYRDLIRLRKQNPALHYGTFELVDEADGDVLAWISKKDASTAVVILNCSPRSHRMVIDVKRHRLHSLQATTLLSSFSEPGQSSELGDLILPPFGSYIGSLTS
jgi:alpha-glucosidase